MPHARTLLLLLAGGPLLFLGSGLAAQQTGPPAALELIPPDRIDADGAPEAILYRQLDLWHYRRNVDRLEEILERLWISNSPYYCAGLARLGNNYRLGLDPDQAVAWYRRGVRECAGTGWAILALSEIAQSEERFCRQAEEAVGDDRTALSGRRLPFPAAEGHWSEEELRYFGLVGSTVIRMACRDDLPDRRDLQEMIAFRGTYSFGDQARGMEPYTEAMVRADLSLRAGRTADGLRNLREAVRRACDRPAAVQALVEATPREAGAPLPFHLNLGAVGLLQELWSRGMLERLDGGFRRCLQNVLHTLRRQFRGDPGTSHQEVRSWYADVDRRLRPRDN